jgi:hypothetical protein
MMAMVGGMVVMMVAMIIVIAIMLTHVGHQDNESRIRPGTHVSVKMVSDLRYEGRLTLRSKCWFGLISAIRIHVHLARGAEDGPVQPVKPNRR